MSTSENGILAIFKYLDDLTKAMVEIKGRAEFSGHVVYSPASYHEIEHAAGLEDTSPVKWFTLVGALTGVFCGFALCLATDYDYPLVVGGKLAGLYSIIAYVIIGFECTILFGAIATIIGMLVMGRIPNLRVNILDPRLTDNRFGIYVPNVDESSSAATFLRDCGAEEIKRLGG